MSDSMIITPTALACEMGVSAKALRAHMRRIADSGAADAVQRVGSGKRYGFTPAEAVAIKASFGKRSHAMPATPITLEALRAALASAEAAAAEALVAVTDDGSDS